MVKWFKDIVAILFVVLFFTSLFFNVRFCISNKKLPINDTTRITVFDTIPYYKPVPKDSTVIKYITQILRLNLQIKTKTVLRLKSPLRRRCMKQTHIGLM